MDSSEENKEWGNFADELSKMSENTKEIMDSTTSPKEPNMFLKIIEEIEESKSSTKDNVRRNQINTDASQNYRQDNNTQNQNNTDTNQNFLDCPCKCHSRNLRRHRADASRERRNVSDSGSDNTVTESDFEGRSIDLSETLVKDPRAIVSQNDLSSGGERHTRTKRKYMSKKKTRGQRPSLDMQRAQKMKQSDPRDSSLKTPSCFEIGAENETELKSVHQPVDTTAHESGHHPDDRMQDADCINGGVDETLRDIRTDERSTEFIKKLDNYTAKETAEVILECQLPKPNITVQWMKDGELVVPDDRINVISEEFIHRLIITNVTLGDAGNFRCICGQASTKCTLTVNELAHDFIKGLENQTEKETATVTLTCQLSRPNKKVQWMKGDQQVIPDDRIAINVDRYTHHLTIRDLNLEDAGHFRCVCGNVSTECILKVEDQERGDQMHDQGVNGVSVGRSRRDVRKKEHTYQWVELLENKHNIDENAMRKLLKAGVLPDQTDIQKAFELCRNEQLKADIFDSICKAISERIKAMSEIFSSVRACYTAQKPEHVVFVAMADDVVEIDPDIEYFVKVRHPQSYSEEGTTITYHDIRESDPVTQQESEEVTCTIQEHADNLFSRHSNIQMISGCTVKSKGFGTENAKTERQLCIVIYVNVKGVIPMHEKMLPSALLSPKTTRMIPVDVREGGMRFLSNKRLKMGCEITTKSKKGSGTLGPFVEKELNIPSAALHSESEYRICCIASAHVFFNDSDTAQQLIDDIKSNHGVYKNETGRLCDTSIFVYQGSNEPFGVVREAAFLSGDEHKAGIDVVLIEILDNSRFPNEGSFPEGSMEAAGFDDDHPMLFNTGLAYDQRGFQDQTRNDKVVVKYGSVTGYTKGSLDTFCSYVKTDDFDATHCGISMLMRKQLLVRTKDFAAPGDSGALVFARHGGDRGDLRAVGIVEGRTEDNRIVVTPIWDILDYFKIKSGLVKFNVPTPMDIDMEYSSQNGSSHSNRITDPGGDAGTHALFEELTRQVVEMKTSQQQDFIKLEHKVQEQTNNMQQQIDSYIAVSFQRLQNHQEQYNRQQEQRQEQRFNELSGTIETTLKNFMTTMVTTMQDMMQQK